MTELLSRLFVKNYKDCANEKVRASYGTMVSIVCIVCNLLLFAGKYTVGLLTLSLSIQADAFNNLSDAGSQIISLVSFRISAKPADRNHPFGYARIEYVASLIVSFLILLAGFSLLKDSASKLLSPDLPETSVWSLVVLGASILVKLWMALLNSRIGKKINSNVMKATAQDSLSDVLSTAAVLVTVIILMLFPTLSFNLDAVMGILVSLLIFKAGIGILISNLNSILGEKPDPEVMDIIKNTVREYPEILGIHDVMIHNYGPNHFIVAFHAEVDGAKDVYESHEVIDTVESVLRNQYKLEATIHLDPIVVGDPKIDALRTKLEEQMAKIGENVKPHDFRFVRGEGHSNLIFDISVPFENKKTNEEIEKEVVTLVKEINKKYEAVFKIDRN